MRSLRLLRRQKLDESWRDSITVAVNTAKPSQQEVLRYAYPIMRMFIARYAAQIPQEQKEEIEQTACLRILEAYACLDATAGWKSYVYNHCRGAVLDYLKFGKGFEEAKWSLVKEEEQGSVNALKIHERVFLSVDDKELDLDTMLGRCGAYVEMQHELHIKWDLVARMASIDTQLHAFAKMLLGFGLEEMAPVFGVSRARVGQLITDFAARFSKPIAMREAWNRQIAFALGIADRFGIRNEDQSKVYGFAIGTNLEPVDLYSLKPCAPRKRAQLSLFEVADAAE